jgi:zinc protease
VIARSLLLLAFVACGPRKAPVAVGAPVAGAPVVAKAPEVVRTALSNGVPVYTVADPSLPLVSVRLTIPVGSVHDPDGLEGTAELVGRMLGESAGGRSSIEQAAALDALAAELGFGIGRESMSMRLDVHADALADALPLAADALLRPAMLTDDFDRVKAQHLAGLASSFDNNATVASLVGARAWWGEAHPYGRPHDGTPVSVRAIQLDRVRAWHAEHAHFGGAAFVVVGATTPQAITAALDLRFGEVEARARAAVAAPPPQGAPGIVLVDRPGASQTVVSVLMPGRGADDALRAEVDAVRTILGGSFTSRLNRRLREELGYTYGARMSVTRYLGGGMIGAGASVRADATGDALVELIGMLRAARKKGVTADEADRGRAQLITGAVDAAETRAGLAGLLMRELADGRDPAALGGWLTAVDALDARRIAPAAATIDPDRAVIVLVGDGATVRAQLAERKLGPPREVEAPR